MPDPEKQRAASDVLPQVYDELRRLAANRLARLNPGQTLQPTALVHEAFVRVVGKQDPGWDNTGHFFGAAANAMRNVLVDEARKKASLKRGGDRAREHGEVDAIAGRTIIEMGDRKLDVLRLEEALERLEREGSERKAEIVTLRVFGSLSLEQIGTVLGVSTRTVDRDWRFARAWLLTELADDDDEKDVQPSAD